MRFLVILSVLALAACASSEPEVTATRPAGNLKSAQAYCLSKGYSRGSFDFESCYRNRPEVQAQERSGRLGSLNIIRENRSPRVRSRSYPVE